MCKGRLIYYFCPFSWRNGGYRGCPYINIETRQWSWFLVQYQPTAWECCGRHGGRSDCAECPWSLVTTGQVEPVIAERTECPTCETRPDKWARGSAMDGLTSMPEETKTWLMNCLMGLHAQSEQRPLAFTQDYMWREFMGQIQVSSDNQYQAWDEWKALEAAEALQPPSDITVYPGHHLAGLTRIP